jgi:hypothetical protein
MVTESGNIAPCFPHHRSPLPLLLTRLSSLHRRLAGFPHPVATKTDVHATQIYSEKTKCVLEDFVVFIYRVFCGLDPWRLRWE